ncbi:MAG: discoidin domain-containing protein, partial [Sarcina sp.]
KEFGDAIKLTFQNNLALNKSVTTESVYNDLADFNGSKILDGNYETYWAPKNGATTGSFEIDLGQATTFDVISLQEYIALGQRVAEFNVQVQQNGSWVQIFSGKTIGYKRLIRLAPIVAQKIRVNITRSLATPLINNFGVYKQPANISLPAQPQGTQLLNDGTMGTGLNQFNFSSGWNYEQTTIDNSYGGDDHWTAQVGATVTVNFVSTKFYLVATKDPGHGIMTISIDGGAEVDIDLYASERAGKKIVFESSILSNTQHKIVIKCSGRKNTSATGIAAFVDGIFVEIPTTLSFINDNAIGTELNQFNFSSGWNYEQTTIDNSYGGDNHWTTQGGATAIINFISTKFYLVATKDPGHGIMTVSIDGGAEVDIDLYANKRLTKQVVFESLTLSNAQHKIVIKCSGRKNSSANGMAGFIDGIFLLNNNGIGLLEIEQKEYTFNENVGVATFKILRKGGANGVIEVDYGTFAGTALDGKNYQPWSGTLSFNNGETEKVVNITIINTNSIITPKNFTLRLSRISGGAILGFNSETNINLQAAITTITSIANLALNKKAVSSSNETSTLTANYVTDGIASKTSRWASGNFNLGQQWIYIDLEKVTEFDKLRIYWDEANATIYRI